MAGKQLFACSFEIFGKVQGVLFRKCAEEHALALGVYGWCKNTADGSVKGQLEAPILEINEMKYWLQNKGSPDSIIKRAVFSPTKTIPKYTYTNFDVKV